jgi:hypothetical protein
VQYSGANLPWEGRVRLGRAVRHYSASMIPGSPPGAGTVPPSDMKKIVPLDTPAAQRLADNASVLQDLRFVQDCCRHLLAILAQPDEQRDSSLMRAIWTAALIAYSRCFGTGKRFGLTEEDVKNLPLNGEVMEFHKWVRDMRDKNVAHSVNPFEQVKVGAVLSGPEAPVRQVEGIGTLAMYYLMPDQQGVWQLGGLASGLAERIQARAQELQEVALSEARELDVEDLYSLPDMRSTAPGPSDAARARTKME